MADADFDLLRANIVIEGRASRATMDQLNRGSARLATSLNRVDRLTQRLDRGFDRLGSASPRQVAKDIDLIGDEARDSSRSVDDLRRRLESLRGRAQAVDSANAATASIRARDARPTNRPRGSGSGGGGGRSLAAGIGSIRSLIGTLAAFEGTRFAVSFARDSAELAKNFEQAQIQFRVLLGDLNKANLLISGLQNFTATTPFSEETVIPSARLLAAFGFETEKIIPTLERLGNISAGTGNRLNELAELYGKARVQGRLFGEDINQFTGRSIPILAALAEVLGTTNDRVKQLVSDGKVGFKELEAAIESLAGSGGQFEGLTEALAQSAAGQISTIKDQINALKRDIGKDVIPIQIKLLEVQRDTLQGLFGERGKNDPITAASLTGSAFRLLGDAAGRIGDDISLLYLQSAKASAAALELAGVESAASFREEFGRAQNDLIRPRQEIRRDTRAEGEGVVASAVVQRISDLTGKIGDAVSAGTKIAAEATNNLDRSINSLAPVITKQINSNDNAATAVNSLTNAIGQGTGYIIRVVNQ